jgi:hypothetical protein
MYVEIGTEAAQFPANEYINGIFIEVWVKRSIRVRSSQSRTSFDGLICVPEGVVPAGHHVRLVGLAVAGRGVQRVLLANCHHFLCKLENKISI